MNGDKQDVLVGKVNKYDDVIKYQKAFATSIVFKKYCNPTCGLY